MSHGNGDTSFERQIGEIPWGVDGISYPRVSGCALALSRAPTLFRILQDTSGNEDVLPATPPESITRSYQS